MNTLALQNGYAIAGNLSRIFGDHSIPGFSPSTDLEWMTEAFNEALRGSGSTNPNLSVGCVIVKDGRELSRGHTEPYRGKHTERVAIDKIKDKSELAGATAYVALEPCSHPGHQGPCSELLASYPFKKVVIARAGYLTGAQGITLIFSDKSTTQFWLGQEPSSWIFRN